VKLSHEIDTAVSGFGRPVFGRRDRHRHGRDRKGYRRSRGVMKALVMPTGLSCFLPLGSRAILFFGDGTRQEVFLESFYR